MVAWGTVMIDLDSLSPYEILDVSPRATIAEIKRAFQIALRTYGGDHMATFGLFTEAEREEILNRVHEAYNILTDPELRRQYDEELRIQGHFPPDKEKIVEPPSRESGLTHQFRRNLAELGKMEDPEVRQEKERLVRELLAAAEETGDWSGSLLRQVREIRGMSLDEIAQHTKISRGHLRNIEEDSFEYLPPDVYVKGFIVQVAKLLGLDPERVSPRLMEHIRRKRGER